VIRAKRCLRGAAWAAQVKATGDGQFPIAAIVGCIDSRASNELILDQGIGDIFSVSFGTDSDL